ncbi:MAG TPA: methionyl-tRNA formyltransferase [Chloroflexota bacterium]|nr:methionyl-tRNA formyltransferase [Chloroflexota bacterium]
MEELRIVFMGTPAFAVPSLRALLSINEIDGTPIHVVGVVTQPDRPAGRGRRLTASPVKTEALAAGIPVQQPEHLRRPEALQALQALAPDLIVVAAFAQILSKRVLDLPRCGCLNVHASLLPRYRGAAPIQAAILDGAPETGVCIMRMEAGLDTGPVLACYREPILPDDTAESLGARLAMGGAELLLRTVPDWVRGAIVPEPQDETQATVTRPLRKEDGRIDWQLPAAYIERQVRAMFPWPGAYTTAGGALLKVRAASVVSAPTAGQTPGTLLAAPEGPYPLVVTGDGLLALREVQPAGRRPMAGADWLRGIPAVRGTVLGMPDHAQT